IALSLTPINNHIFMKSIFHFLTFITLVIFFSGCSGSKETYERGKETGTGEGSLIRVLLDEQPDNYKFTAESSVYLKQGKSYLALLNKGNTLSISNSGSGVEIEIGDKSFKGDDFELVSESSDASVDYKGSSYRGSINIIPDGSGIRIINFVSIEQYLKGVIPREMPAGKGDEYYEALKAFAICARTYTVSKINENKKLFDVFADTRDQVYGGSGTEKEIINKVVDETRGLILTYDNKLAVTFYHSTCGGYTEDAKNVFPDKDLPYLKVVKDGDEPYCSISPKFTWKEKMSKKTFIQRLVDAKYLDDTEYSVKDIKINSTFESGRINELEIDLADRSNNSRSIKLYGNNIRYVIRTANGKSILESNNFTVKIDPDNIIIDGRGYGHGVGLCQWGALAQSQQGKSYEDILAFYYPGTKIESLNDL
ncbi:MAG TPA: SpoIID/LytB domain-containing protein, partial [Ignavibacteriaceae bacterium]